MAYDQLALTVTYTMFPMQFATAWGGPSGGDHVKNSATTGMETCNAK